MAASGGGPEAPHRPVLLFEAVELLAPERGGLFVDATLGLGGHSEAILAASPDTRVLGIDRDREAIRLASERLARFGPRFRAVHANSREISRILDEADEREVSGRQAIRCRTASVRSARPKSAPARQAALLRPFGVTDFSGLAMSASNVLAMKVFGMSERA